MSEPRGRLVLEPLVGEAEVGYWLAALEDARRRTLLELETVTPEMLDRPVDGPLTTIGSLLYHIGLIEASWLLEDILEGDPGPDWLQDVLPFDDRDADGRLTVVLDEPLSVHRERLARIRALLLDRLRPMTSDDLHRPRRLDRYDAAPDWVLHHLLQHEAEHRAHIALLRDTLAG